MVSKKTAAAWIDEQLNLSISTYADLTTPVSGAICNGLSGTTYTQCGHRYLTADPVIMRFHTNAVSNDDQLRQRVAFALSQITVASEAEVHNAAGLAVFQQIFLSNSFGNYRTILKSAIMSSYMDDYLDMTDSKKTDPNENYARELMKLFSIGTTLLNPDAPPN